MAPCLMASIEREVPELQEALAGVETAESMDELVAAVTVVVRELGVRLLQTVVGQRAAAPTEWPACPTCGRRLHCKERAGRSVMTSLGQVNWARRIGRCPQGCKIGQVVPFDQVLGLAPNQRHSTELKRSVTLLAVFVPLATATAIVERLMHVHLAASTLWHWIQSVGRRAQADLEAQLAEVADGGEVAREPMEATFKRLLMLMGADGVMVPFRPQGGSPKGAAVWREVKVAVLARLDKRRNRAGKTVTALRQRRLVAVLGDIDQLALRLKLEALRQGITTAPRAMWISDGARGLWRLYREHLAGLRVIGVMDFYHTVGQIWTAAETWYQYQPSARQWLEKARHRLRKGEVAHIINQLRQEAADNVRSDEQRHIMLRVAQFLENHSAHLDYPTLKADDLPIGSGFVESAVKWLIQQRFKGVGMRWSEDGFNNLLMLRLAWANDRFDTLFTPSPNS